MKRLKLTLLFILSFWVISFLLVYFFHMTWTFKEVGPDTDAELLQSTAKLALESLDVPVASILYYQGAIIGKGYNDVRRRANAGGHAEINAISDAMKNVGIDRFNLLDRGALALISTYEPCPMCRGAILEYRIDNVSIYKPKDFISLLKEDFGIVLYQFRLSRLGSSSLQDSLFSLHPQYPRK